MSALSDLYALIPAQGYILGADLPAVFAQYEAQRGTDLLQPSEREALVGFGKQNAGERVDAEVLVSLMGQLLGAGSAASQGRPEDTDKGNPSIGGVESGRVTSAPFRGLALSLADTADISLLGDTEPPFTPIAPDTPDNDLEFGEAGITGYALDINAGNASRKKPSGNSGNAVGKPSTPATTSQIPRRRPGHEGKPISGSPAPPSSYTPIPRSAGRRGSDPASTPNKTPLVKPTVRSSSALSNHSFGTSGSGGSSGIVRPRPPRTSTSSRRSMSPSSIGTAIRPLREDTARQSSATTSQPDPFRVSPSRPRLPGSPELPALQGVDSELSMLDETSFVGRGLAGDLTVDEDEEQIHGRHGSRLDRISTASTSSLAATHDALQALKRENSELVKKKNELARQLQVIGAETEAQMADLQESLDGARAELAGKRKEEKESRTREAQLGTQICTLELEMQHLQQQLSTARESHATQQRMLQDANAEADRLRETLLSKEEDVAGLKVVIEGYEDEKRSWEDQLETLQATNATLQSSLHAAQEAARTLERRKAENQELQQTIKRLTHELDILRTQQSTGARHGREPTDASAGTGSVALRDGTARMSLSDELRSHFAEAGEDSDEETTGGGKRQTVVRTVTYRTERVVRHRDTGAADDASGESEPETSLVEEIVREYTDVGVGTDPQTVETTSTSIQTDESHHGVLPPYSPRSDVEIAKDALAHAHPALEVSEKVDLERHGELAIEYARVTTAVGMRCTLIEEKLRIEQDGALRVQGGEPIRERKSASSGISSVSLVYLCAAILAVGAAGYYLGWRRNHFQQLDAIRRMLQEYTLPYSHLYVQEFIPRTAMVRTLAGGVKQFAGRTPI